VPYRPVSRRPHLARWVFVSDEQQSEVQRRINVESQSPYPDQPFEWDVQIKDGLYMAAAALAPQPYAQPNMARKNLISRLDVVQDLVFPRTSPLLANRSDRFPLVRPLTFAAANDLRTLANVIQSINESEFQEVAVSVVLDAVMGSILTTVREVGPEASSDRGSERREFDLFLDDVTGKYAGVISTDIEVNTYRSIHNEAERARQLTSQIEDQVAKVERRAKQLRGSVGELGERELSNEFRTHASVEGFKAAALSVLSVVALGLVAWVGWNVLRNVSDLDLEVLIAKLAITLPVLAVSGYLGRLSGQYRHSSRWGRTAAVQLRTLGMFPRRHRESGIARRNQGVAWSSDLLVARVWRDK
jgi:hypothetical protein